MTLLGATPKEGSLPGVEHIEAGFLGGAHQKQVSIRTKDKTSAKSRLCVFGHLESALGLAIGEVKHLQVL